YAEAGETLACRRARSAGPGAYRETPGGNKPAAGAAPFEIFVQTITRGSSVPIISCAGILPSNGGCRTQLSLDSRKAPPLQTFLSDVMPVVHSVEVNFLDCRVGVRCGRGKIGIRSRDAEHPSSGCFEPARPSPGPSLEDIRATSLDSRDEIPGSNLSRIAGCRQNHTDGWFRFPAQRNSVKVSRGSSQENLAKRAVEPVHQRLRFRIA